MVDVVQKQNAWLWSRRQRERYPSSTHIMTTFYLLRHGARVSREENTSISDIGKKQAELTANYLKNLNISEIYASPLKRTQETAQIISRILKLSVKTDNRLRERLLWEDRKNESFDEFLSEWIKTTIDRNYQPLFGDASYMAGDRMKSLINEITKDNINVLIVAHAGVITDFLRNVFKDANLPIVIDPLSKERYIEILECSITIVHNNGEKYQLEKVNDINHLPLPIV